MVNSAILRACAALNVLSNRTILCVEPQQDSVVSFFFFFFLNYNYYLTKAKILPNTAQEFLMFVHRIRSSRMDMGAVFQQAHAI